MSSEGEQETIHRETLERAIPFRNYVALGLGVIVGVGWVVYSGQWLLDGGPLGAAIGFLLGGLLLLPIGMCYAELTAALPLAGGEMCFTYKAFGPRAAFLTAWLIALVYVAVTPFETIAIGALLETLIPAIATDPLYFVGTGENQERVAWSTVIPGVTIGALLTWINYRGVKDSARFQLVSVALMLACTLIFCCVAIVRGDPSNLTPYFAGVEGSISPIAASVSAIIAVLVVVPFFMSGFDTIPQAAEESGAKVPPRQLGLAILISIASGSVFYVLIILAVAITMPWTVSSALPMTTSAVFEEAFGLVWAAKLVIVAALLGLVTTLNGMYVASSRLVFSLGRGGLLPHWFAEVHPVHHTPKNALLFVGAISLIGPFVGKYALIPIVSSNSFVFSIAMVVTSAAAIRLRKTSANLPRPYRPAKAFLYLGLVFSVALVLLMVWPNSPGRIGQVETTVVSVWLVIGFLAYVWRQRRHRLDKTEQDYLILGDYR